MHCRAGAELPAIDPLVTRDLQPGALGMVWSLPIDFVFLCLTQTPRKTQRAEIGDGNLILQGSFLGGPPEAKKRNKTFQGSH